MKRRAKSFPERRQELIGAVSIIANALRDFEDTKQIYPLRVIAIQLRALIVLEEGSRNFSHPLLIDLANEAGYSLTVYVIDPKVTDDMVNMLTPHSMEFFSTGDSISIEKKPPYMSETVLVDALEEKHIVINEQDLNMKEVIRHIADTEAAHYDTTRPLVLDELEQIQLGGLHSAYRTVYMLGQLVRDLSYRFIEATV